MGTVVRGARPPFGPIVNDTGGAGTTYRHAGGEGVCLWKTLVNGAHLEGDWNLVEHLVIRPGGSVGEHVHTRTEEIYYILRGRAVMTMNDVEFPVRAGDLITTPIGAAHAIANREDEDMHFFVIEVFPRDGAAGRPSRVAVPELASGPEGRRRAVVDLRPHFTGDWRTFSLIEVPEDGTAVREAPPGNTQVLYVVSGTVEFEVDGEHHRGGAGTCLAVGPRTTWTARAHSALTLISTEVGVR
ncbi:cupin domain-containing protein [Umezawaea tangerina]|uniref:Cupin domain-containing protein n=1 Tax=Umezawaea tangerina TaxID=84725 RepID=A0A2T0SZS5_9PSEU|nr:cupin domain-containing protein [Umezawaea tangerina]PRY38917.1 Cupin domain-containing protein [Umezawaea tangerina]